MQARRFLLAHHALWPPRKLKGVQGVVEFIRSVGTIQFDPINVVGRNADLVLQSRIRGYKPEMLHELLYKNRKLLDGFDKVASIYETADWPYFKRRRDRIRAEHGQPSNPVMKIADEVIEAIRMEGPKSSIDFKSGETIKWNWGVNTSLPRACLEILYGMGEVVVHDRIGTRRYFELAERALPRDVFTAVDPNVSTDDYEDWHVLRRVGGLGIANPAAGDWWLGLNQVDAPQRKVTTAGLVERRKLTVVEIEDVPDRAFLIRSEDIPTIDRIRRGRPPKPRAALIGALDNLMWDRNMLRWVFDFDYIWEVYKPVAQRRYGYYVLPVLYGDRFIARVDPSYDRERRELTINNWWWEDKIEVDDQMQSALASCFQEFMRYLKADRMTLGPKAKRKAAMGWVQPDRSAA